MSRQKNEGHAAASGSCSLMNSNCSILDSVLFISFVFYSIIGCYIFGTCYGKDDKKIVDEVVRFIRMRNLVVVTMIFVISYSNIS